VGSREADTLVNLDSKILATLVLAVAYKAKKNFITPQPPWKVDEKIESYYRR